MLNVQGMTPMSAKESILFIDDELQRNATGFEFKANISTKACAVLGQRGETTRVDDIKITGSFKMFKKDPWLQEYVQFIRDHGYHRRFDLTAMTDSEGSDYYEAHGTQTITLTNCVLTGDITLMMGDTSGDNVEENLTFEAESMI